MESNIIIFGSGSAGITTTLELPDSGLLAAGEATDFGSGGICGLRALK